MHWDYNTTIKLPLKFKRPKRIIPGYKINAGEILGRSGNTGTRPSTLGTKAESHLHWELILQDSQGEYYFGQDLDYELLVSALNQIFDN